MKKSFSIFFLTLLIGLLACGTTAPRSTPEPAPVAGSSSTPESASAPQSSPVVQLESTPAQTISAPSGLRVVYIRDGNLWSWTEAGGSVQLTETGDMSSVHLSDDGQLLAFVRGLEVWTVRMDGTDARFLSRLDKEGSALWFAPVGSLLSISMKDRINVIDLNNANSTTVVTYPTIPDGYYPEVVWSPDGLGFKTVIPPQTETDQAELIFVFTDGTVASLAKFTMLPVTESLPYISPDGGYIIYVANLDGDKESLYLMDSSGATRPYGEPGENIQAYGWLPDSKQFAFGAENSQGIYLGNIGGPPVEITVASSSEVRWIDTESYLTLENSDLVLGNISAGKLTIDSDVQTFDFSP